MERNIPNTLWGPRTLWSPRTLCEPRILGGPRTLRVLRTLGRPRALRGSRTLSGPGPYENPGHYENSGPYEDPKFFDDPWKTQAKVSWFPHHVFNLVEFTIKGRFIYHCWMHINLGYIFLEKEVKSFYLNYSMCHSRNSYWSVNCT